MDIAHYGQLKQAWLATFLELPGGIHSHDTFRRVFSLLDPQLLEQCFRQCTATVAPPLPREVVAIAGKTVRRSGSTLWLYPSKAKPLQLRNNPTENPDANVGYEYLSSLPTIHQWLVSVHLYEGGYFMLVDQRTGRRTRIWSPPAVAPDGRHFVCGNSDVLARYEPSGLQLWSVDGTTLRLLWERQTEWGCTQPRWLDNKTILFEQDFFDNGDVDTRVVRLTVVP